MPEPMKRYSSSKVINFFGTLNHRIRIKIIELLFEHTELSYTELLQTLNIPDGKLNFHLRKIKDLIVLDNGKYRLSHLGITANKFLREIQSEYGYGVGRREALILIIDDDRGMCETLSDIFREKGYMTDAAYTG
ncbi:MAG: helix-turn-helix domain-containing protein, partial [Candidatus Hydrothermarchaeales archaeon]